MSIAPNASIKTSIKIGLGSNSKNGTWQTFTRDLKADLKAYEPDNELLTVNGFLVRGSGRVDDIAMIEYGNETVKDNAEDTSKTLNITYQQNALNQRVAKLVDGEVVEKYLWANLTTLLATYDANDNLIQRFEYANGRMPVAMTSNGQKYYLHYNQVGSLRAISRVLSPDNTTELVKEITYDTYGNIINDSNPSFKIPFGFAGGLYDSDTKLTRFGYRDYDAYTGKWTAKDPIGFSGGDSNLYGYVLGDPVNLVDPTGENPFLIIGGIIGVGYAIGDYIRDLTKSEVMNESYKQGFCKAYNTATCNKCDAALTHMNSYCGTNTDCRDYSSLLYNQCIAKTLSCGE